MMAAVARAVMALAVRRLCDHRPDWARAMQVEFEQAREDGKPLAFAIGCLLTACRELPAHDSGRFAIASYVFALGMIVPVTALTLSSVLTEFPASFLGHVGVHGLLETGSPQGPLLSDGNRFAVPSLAILVLLFAGLNLRIAWLALDRDWARLANVGALSAAATATLVILSAVVFIDYVAAFSLVATLSVELAAAFALARWHARLTPVPQIPSNQKNGGGTSP